MPHSTTEPTVTLTMPVRVLAELADIMPVVVIKGRLPHAQTEFIEYFDSLSQQLQSLSFMHDRTNFGTVVIEAVERV